MTKGYPPPDTSASTEERQALSVLAPLRSTLERMMQRQLTIALGKPPESRLLSSMVERHWTLILEAYRQGVRTVNRGLHRAEGLDHEMVDQAVDYALRDQLGADAAQKARKK